MKQTYISIIEENESRPKDSNQYNGLSQTLKRLVVNVLSKVLPVGNPDFGDRVERVKEWLIEIDKESGVALREIGLDETGEVILKSPWGRNYGVWTDSPVTLLDFIDTDDEVKIQKARFDSLWNDNTLVE
jgi:hypothetical protein